MEILKKGKKNPSDLRNKVKKYFDHKSWLRKEKCKECGTKFRYHLTEDTYVGTSVIGQKNYYVDCPVCKKSIFVCRKIV